MRKFFNYFFLFILIGIVLITAGFFIPRKGSGNKNCEGDSVSISIGTNGYHTSFIVPVKNFAYDWTKELPVKEDIQYIEFGWGNKRFYMSRDFSLKATLSALFPSQTVMHVVYLDKDPQQWFKSSKGKRIRICKEDYLSLIAYIKGSFKLDTTGQKIYLGKGLYGPSSFYKATGDYHIFETCNTWVAKGLRVIHIQTPLWGGTAPAIMWHLREY